MTQRYRNALAIQEGACNPSGIAHSIVEACTEMRAEPDHTGTDEICTDPAIRLMVHQLAFLVGAFEIENDFEAYTKAADACREKLTVT